MPAPFAALEARVNASVFSRMANASALLGGVSVDGIFDGGYQLATVGAAGMAGSLPSFTVPTGAVPVNPVGLPLTINAIAYTIAAHEPDGTGASALYLELA